MGWDNIKICSLCNVFSIQQLLDRYMMSISGVCRMGCPENLQLRKSASVSPSSCLSAVPILADLASQPMQEFLLILSLPESPPIGHSPQLHWPKAAEVHTDSHCVTERAQSLALLQRWNACSLCVLPAVEEHRSFIAESVSVSDVTCWSGSVPSPKPKPATAECNLFIHHPAPRRPTYNKSTSTLRVWPSLWLPTAAPKRWQSTW